MVDKNFVAEYLPVVPIQERTSFSSTRTNETVLEKRMQGVWNEKCSGEIHYTNVFAFATVCNQLGFSEDVCLNFALSNSNLITSASETLSTPGGIEKTVSNAYKGYPDQHGIIKTEPIHPTHLNGHVPVNNRQKEQGKIQEDTDFLTRIELSRIDLDSDIEELKPRISIEGNCISTPGNLTVFAGTSKSGKSGVKNAIIAKAIQTDNIHVDGLGFELENNSENKLVLDVDTEQDDKKHKRSGKTILKNSGLELQPKHFQTHNLRNFSPQQRRDALTYLLKKYSKQFNGVYLICIDGIGDYVNSVNDEEECNATIRFFEGLATEYDCPVLTILHYNPNSEKGRGHLGSQLERKCESLLSITKDKEGIGIIEGKLLRNAGITPILQFAYSKDKGYHVSMGRKEPGSERQEKFDALKTDVIGFLEHGKKQMSFQELAEMFMTAEHIKSRAAHTRIAQLLKANVIYYTTHKKQKIALHELFCK